MLRDMVPLLMEGNVRNYFMSKKIQEMDENSDITDWGLKEYNNMGSGLRKYFV